MSIKKFTMKSKITYFYLQITFTYYDHKLIFKK